MNNDIKRYSIEAVEDSDDEDTFPALDVTEDAHGQWSLYEDIPSQDELVKLKIENVQLKAQATILRIEVAHLEAGNSNITFP